MARSQPQSNPVRIRFVEFELDEANACLLRHGETVALAPTPFALLCELARQPGALLSKNDLLDAVWGHQFVSDSVLKTAISNLRTALGDDPAQPRFIETVSRRGYRFIAAPTPVSSMSAPSMPIPSAPAASAPLASTPPVSTAPASTQPLAPFIGRASEFARLKSAWARAGGGQRAVVWVAGEPGVGKTTLIEQFITSLDGAACARGHCVEHYGSGEPYLPVLEALADLCRSDPTLPTLLRAVAPTWLLQLPWLNSAEERDALRRELAGIGPDRMLRELGELLDRYTAQHPLLLVTEDLHWSDRGTVQLIDYIARRRGPACLMWLASFRVAEVIALDHPLNALRRELRLHRLCEELALDAFSEAEVADYVARHSASLARDEAFVRGLHTRSDGVPLFVASLLGEVMDRSGDDAAIVAWLENVAVPENLAAIIEHAIARLAEDQRTLLSTAAVCGAEFRVATVALAQGGDIVVVADACEALVRAHVWLLPALGTPDDAAEPSYAFRHALFRQVLYERTPSPLRKQLHGQVGAALERERAAGGPVAAAELALHFDRARQPLPALRYYAEAAEAALGHFSPQACLSLIERTAALLRQAPEGPERTALDITLSTLHGLSAIHALGAGSDAIHALQRAYALLEGAPEHPIRGRLLHGFGYLLCLRGEYAESLGVARRAEALALASDDPQLMLVAAFLHGEVHHVQGRSRLARPWLERALTIAESLDNGGSGIFAMDPQVALHGLLAVELVRCGLIGQAQSHIRRAQARAQALRQPMAQLAAGWYEVLVEVRLDRPARVKALVDDIQALVDTHALALGRTACCWWRGWADARNGVGQDSHRRIREAYQEHIGLGMRSGGSEVLGYATEALLLAGDVEAAQAELQEALRLAGELDEHVYLPQLLILEAAIERAQGRSGADAARRAIEEARTQEAPWLELRAHIELCEHHTPLAEERAALAALLARLPEAHDTELAASARALIDGVKPA